MWIILFISMFWICGTQNNCFAKEGNVLFKITQKQYTSDIDIADKAGNVLFRLLNGKFFKNEQGKPSFTIKQEHEGVTAIALEYTPQKKYVFFPYYDKENGKYADIDDFYRHIDETKRRTNYMRENIITMLVKIRENIGSNIPENKKNEHLLPIIKKLCLDKSKLTTNLRVAPNEYNARWNADSVKNLIEPFIEEYKLKSNLETLKGSLSKLKQKLTTLSEKLNLLNKKLTDG